MRTLTLSVVRAEAGSITTVRVSLGSKIRGASSTFFEVRLIGTYAGRLPDCSRIAFDSTSVGGLLVSMLNSGSGKVSRL